MNGELTMKIDGKLNFIEFIALIVVDLVSRGTDDGQNSGQRIGSRENLHRKPSIFQANIFQVSCNFSHQSIQMGITSIVNNYSFFFPHENIAFVLW